MPAPSSFLPWNSSGAAVLSELGTQRNGLAESEIPGRKQRFGSNTLTAHTHRSPWKILLQQFTSPLILILLVASGVTAFLETYKDSIVLLATVLANAALGYWQEAKAEQAIQHLTKYVRVRARVRRDGREYEVDAEALVPGDIIRLTQGERVPADVRLLTVNRLHVDESVLTGESLPAEKQTEPLPAQTALGDRTNMAFLGTIVSEGYADGVVVATGNATAFGRVATLTVNTTPQLTPLQRAVRRFALYVTGFLLFLVAGVFTLGVLRGQPLSEMLLIAVALAASAVPEGLPITLTVILAVGVERLAKRNAIVRKLLAGETLGSTSVILTDKTGTLTEAKMTLTRVQPAADIPQETLLRHALSCVDVVIENPEAASTEWTLLGRPMEQSLVREAMRFGADYRTVTPLVHDRIPFTSARKSSGCTTSASGAQREVRMGAPEFIFSLARLPRESLEAWKTIIATYTESGERMIAVASAAPKSDTWTLEGVLGFRDPVRASVPAAVARIQAAGVRTVIVTGDHPGTARAIGEETGILPNDAPGHAVMTAEQWESLDPRNRKMAVERVQVFARVAPEQKAALVKTFLANGHVVAVTGDGVNDGPALEAADIGVAVGSGTDVAKDVADLVILDDNFESIVTAIEEGRRILGNMRTSIVFLLSDAFTTLTLTGGALLLGIPLPLLPLQILYINFFSDSFPAIAYAFERSGGLRTRRDVRIPDAQMGFLILINSLAMSTFLFILYLYLQGTGQDAALTNTIVFASYGIGTMMSAIGFRNLDRPFWTLSLRDNPVLVSAVVFGVLLMIAGVYLPLAQSFLNTVAIPARYLWIVAGCAVLELCYLETAKWAFTHARRDA